MLEQLDRLFDAAACDSLPVRDGWPTMADVERAARTLEGVVENTPCVRSSALARMTGADPVLKYENRQHTGSFKVRGAYVKLASLAPRERSRGVIAASAGNHAQGVAYNASRMRIASTIVMPEATPYCKIRNTEALGARVVLHGAGMSEASELARRTAREQGLTYVPAFDDPAVVAGAGTVALEMLRAVSGVDVLLVQVGGGGLIAGMGLVAKTLHPEMEVVAVQTELFAGLRNALHGAAEPAGGATLAEGVAVARVGELNLAMARAFVDDVLLVDEESLERAVHVLLEEERTLVEGAGAVGVAALLRYPERFAGKRVGLVLSGGNIDTGLLAYVISRVRLREGRVVCLRAEMLDVPGGLARVAAVVAEYGANVLEVSHQRQFPSVLAKRMQLDLTIEVRRPGDAARIVAHLNELGFYTTLPKEKSA